MSEEFPRPLGNYTLLRRLAVGGMAELFLARKAGLEGADKDVVIKRILPGLAEDEGFVARFLNEAKLASLLNHAAVVRTYDLGRADGTLFLAQEYVDGVDLRQLLRLLEWSGRRMPPAIAAAIGARVAEALDYAHHLTAPGGTPLGLVHRDVSPDNVLISRDGQVKLVDFGVAKAFASAPRVTRGILGKIHFMSPEQAQDQPLDGRSDLFSLGALLYLLTTGADAFEGTNDYAVLTQVISQAPLPPSERVPGYPPRLERIVLKALSKQPADRHPTGAELAAQLNEFARDAGAHLTTRELADFVADALAAPRGQSASVRARFATPAMPSVAQLSALSDDLQPLPVDTIDRMRPVAATRDVAPVPADTARDLKPLPGADTTAPVRPMVATPVVVPLPASLKHRPPIAERTGETNLTRLTPGSKAVWVAFAAALALAALTLFILSNEESEGSGPPPTEAPASLRSQDPESDTRMRGVKPPLPGVGEATPVPEPAPSPEGEPTPERRR